MKLIKITFCLLLLSSSSADDSVLKHEPPPELGDEDFASESNATQLDPGFDQEEGLCVVSLNLYTWLPFSEMILALQDMVGQGWILMPIHDSLGGSDCSFDRKCRAIECCR